MKKYPTFEEAITQYTEYTGRIPEIEHIIEVYHRYRSEYKGYKSFIEWMIYNEEAI